MIASIGYDSEADVENPTGSVFCAHGAGFVVPWNEVEDHMHLEYTLENPEEESDSAESAADRSGGASSVQKAKKASDRVPMAASLQEAKELEEIFTRTYGKVERKRAGFERADTSGHLVIRHRGSQICKIKPPEGAAGGISAGGRL